MRIYFYHTQDIQYILGKHRIGRYPGHLLYGAIHLEEMGFDIVWHKFIPNASRLKLMLLTTWRILRQRRRIDAVYATHYKGIEPLIFLRALHLFNKPIVLWHHQPIIHSESVIRELLGKLFYRGIDEMLFFSQKLIDDSVSTRKADPSRMHLGYWGADLDFYDRLRKTGAKREGFISSGKERRDFPTLINAFSQTDAQIDVYVPSYSGQDYAAVFSQLNVSPNIHVHMDVQADYEGFAKEVNRHACVAICCQETKYTVGLTTVVEAMALGMPIICSRNPQIPIDFDKERCGIAIPYYNIEGWKNAIEYIQGHPKEANEMGLRGRKLAETTYNDRHCAEIAAELLLKVCHKKNPKD
jgi:glycosyltransferase involved in cell wall biosynthesis